ncbi:hypothetical protein SO802_015722 [Lithocarpus litseifolius]|uniref:Uncharacterized protein n=1 Tax=Lithocarpus litseifolius TaxID=425828 RepID=A0AAW2CZT5_9ROSI
MVVPLGPGKFYGSSLPRPRIYTDVKYSDERVDPPVPVLDPFMSWANEAHWSMGGLSFTRLRFQGRIEGSVTKLRAERERMLKKEAKSPDSPNESGSNRLMKPVLGSDSPPPAPIATKRRRYLAMIEEEEEEEEEVVVVKKRRLVKKLGDDFDKVAMESERNKKVEPKKDSGLGSGSVAMKTRSRVEEEVGERVNKSNSKGKKLKGGSRQPSGVKSGNIRTSPRLAKRGSP